MLSSERTKGLRNQFPYTLKILLLFGSHALLAVLIDQFPILSTIHAYLTLLVGLFILITEKHPQKMFVWMAYITGMELLWRGTGANVFWEWGKYLTIAFGFLAIMKYRGEYEGQKGLIPYFLLLLPSVLLLPSFDREAISFALAGPLALVVASMFFSKFRIDTEQFKRILLAILSPVISFSILILLGIIQADVIEFSQGSNFLTSANTGPNQVSSLLSLGTLSAVLILFLDKQHKFLRVVIFLIAIGLSAQMALTFSRGGLWTLILAFLAAVYFFLRDKHVRLSVIFITLLAVLVISYLVVPALDRFTSGELSKRMSDTDPTGRVEIVRADLEVFLENPVFGIGPGQSNVYHARYFRVASAHTEFSRMLAEHGLFGLISLLIFLVILIRKLLTKEPVIHKAVIWSFIVWGCLFMAHSATRLVAPSFLIGLAFANFSFENPDASEKQQAERINSFPEAKRSPEKHF